MIAYALRKGKDMHTAEVTSPQFQSALKSFAKYLVDLSKLTTFDSVSKAEEKTHERLGLGFEEMDTKEMHIVTQFQQLTEIYARDRQMQLTGRNPYEIIIAADASAMKCGQ
jgi:hypothetical protein